MHLALLLQIIQAFSQIVAAGSAWSSALLLVDAAASQLQFEPSPEPQPLVSKSPVN